MKIMSGNEVLYETPPTNISELHRQYTDHESAQGRAVPSYALDGLILSLSLFLLGQAIAAKMRQKDRARQQRRHDELLKKLDAIEAMNNAEQRIKEVRAVMAELGLSVKIAFESDAEKELQRGFEKVLPPAQQ